MTATSRVCIGGMKRRRRTTSWTRCTNTGFRMQSRRRFCSAWSKAFRAQPQVCVHIETIDVWSEILTYACFFLSKSSMWNHYETVIFLFLYFRGDFSAVLAHGGLQAEEVPASSGAAALWEFGVQDPALCEEGKTGARRRRERRGDDCVQGEKIKTFPSDDNKPTPGAKPWSKNWGEPVNFQLWTFYIICFDFNVTRRQNRNIFLNFFFYLCSLSSTNT